MILEALKRRSLWFGLATTVLLSGGVWALAQGNGPPDRPPRPEDRDANSRGGRRPPPRGGDREAGRGGPPGRNGQRGGRPDGPPEAQGRRGGPPGPQDRRQGPPNQGRLRQNFPPDDARRNGPPQGRNNPFDGPGRLRQNFAPDDFRRQGPPRRGDGPREGRLDGPPPRRGPEDDTQRPPRGEERPDGPPPRRDDRRDGPPGLEGRRDGPPPRRDSDARRDGPRDAEGRGDRPPRFEGRPEGPPPPRFEDRRGGPPRGEQRPDGPPPRREGPDRRPDRGDFERFVRQSDYWIGVSCREAEEVLQRQLKLSTGQGLVVQRVLEGSPAAKANLQRHDVLLQVGEVPLSKIQDLSKLIDDAKEEAITIDILRDGDHQSITITPKKRKGEESRQRRDKEASE